MLLCLFGEGGCSIDHDDNRVLSVSSVSCSEQGIFICIFFCKKVGLLNNKQLLDWRDIMASKVILGCAAFVLFFSAPFFSGAASWNPLPDTGQTKCYDADGNEITCPAEGEPFYGQDAQYQGASPSYIDNGDGTVTDKNTGLIWQKDTADTNKDGSITSDDYPTGDKMTWQETVDYCDGLVFGNRSDWRLPDVMELESLVDYSGAVTGVNAAFNCASGRYWSSDFPAELPALAWAVGFPAGGHYWPSREDQYYVRCVADVL